MATVEAPTRPQIRLHEGPFVNEPLTDFNKEENARKMRAAIEKVRGQLSREYDLVIEEGQEVTRSNPSTRRNPRRSSDCTRRRARST
jgi:1-pyrroline-5-carboxylate dehydrogenase